ncbi:hypothetical protein M407DRAFT_23445 [Tulasnella calospora MUT 4182]|uniref:Fatty acid hydroxylase domain-containing protein n=1 Tax=Tulasnella calospora MUT 4182 TaxID=1051891 RepID=A0A0C3QJH4_9AGAM|nr:hypothetical protein M407DRAFT_23445 [Tulasnella calospora MUT 4182]
MNSTFYVSDPTALGAPWYYTSAPSLIPGIHDKYLSLASPIIMYWTLSIFFHLLDNYSHCPPFSWMGVERYRIHDSEEMKSRNKATPGEVLGAVIFQQVIQTMAGYWWIPDDTQHPPAMSLAEHGQAMQGYAPWVLRVLQVLLGDVTAAWLIKSYGNHLVYWVYWWIVPTLQTFLAFFVIDTWQYFMHRLFHVNKFLYRHFHSVHHRLYVPYAYGALYNHPLEGFLLDTTGAGLAEFIARSSIRQTALIFGFASAKTVDDHCGFSLPWDPLQFFYRNNARYHDIHHQTYGLKYNFSQPFWIHWDIILGTRWDKPNRPLAAEKRALAAAEAKRQAGSPSPSNGSDLSEDSGVAMEVNKED